MSGDSWLIILLLFFMFGRKKENNPSEPTMHNKEVITWVDRKGRKRSITTEREVHYE